MVKKLEAFMKRNCKTQIKTNTEHKKKTKRKINKLYVKWKGYDNSFNNWINKKDIV